MESQLVIVALVASLLATLVIQFLGVGRNRQVERLDRRLLRLERKLQLVLDHLGIQERGSDLERQVDELLMEGGRIQAIKAYREATGVGLQEAKNAVDRMARERGCA
jgi:ribosomal protein L7/L12